MILLSKIYDGESIVDMSRDIDEVFDHRFNPIVLKIPVNKWHIMEGNFKVTIEWSKNDD